MKHHANTSILLGEDTIGTKTFLLLRGPAGESGHRSLAAKNGHVDTSGEDNSKLIEARFQDSRGYAL